MSGSLSIAHKVVFDSNNNPIIASYYKDSATFGQQGLDLRKLDASGNTLLRKRYLFDNLDFLSYTNNKFVLDFSPNKMFVSGGSFIGSVSTLIYACIDKNTLDTLWTKKYFDGINNINLTSVYKVKPNEIWYIGGRGDNTTNGGFILKIDTLGNIVGTKFLNLLYNYENSKLIFHNNLLYYNGLNYNTNPFTSYNLTCIDTTGVIIWNKQVSASTGVAFGDSKVIGNELWACGRLKVSSILSNGEHKMTLWKFNASNGDLLWQKSYGNAFLQNYFTSLYNQPDGSFILTGTHSNKPLFSALRHDGVIFKVNSNGDSLWMRTYDNYPGNGQEIFYDLKPTLDGGYIMCGGSAYMQAPLNQSWVVKTDSLGMAPGMLITNLGVEQSSSKSNSLIYPNPASNKVIIENKNLLKSTLSIFSSDGRILLQKELGAESINEIDVEQLPNGVYIVDLQSTDGASYKRKLVIER